jgi:Leucine-rich repeat (LRR) protein
LLWYFAFVFNFSKAQFVTIPDTNFVNWLNNNGYSSCMNGNQLNSSCPAVQNTTALNLLNETLPDITGIHAFTNLTSLNVTNCGCGNEGSLPSSLISLGLYNNAFFNLYPLPPNLEILDCGSNYLNSLPPLPATLTSIFYVIIIY